MKNLQRNCSDNFNSIPLTHIAATLASVIGVEPPTLSEGKIDCLQEYIVNKSVSKKAERVLIYNPDAIGQWIVEKYKDKFKKVLEQAPFTLNMKSVIPPKTPVCFASMYSGASPEIHGIQKYTKPVLTVCTLFDTLIKAGKKPCIVTVANQSMDLIFRERNMDYYSLCNDNAVIEKALELIKEDKYDFICVYNQEYDDVMHRTHPCSKGAVRAIEHYADSFDRLAKAVKSCWQQYDSLIAYLPDHGVHREWYFLGQHGKNIPKDMNIIHFYGVIPKK